MAMAQKKGIVSMRWVLVSMLLLGACQRNDSTSAQTSQVVAEGQMQMDSASIICRDGTAYLMGQYNRGGFATPYIRKGKFVSCDSKNNVIASDGNS